MLSKFGLVPAAAMGLDLERFLDETETHDHELRPAGAARQPIRACGSASRSARSPPNAGATRSRSSPATGCSTMGAWLEQLIAESTGKNGKGLIPVDREALGDPDAYGDDRVFVHLQAGRR